MQLLRGLTEFKRGYDLNLTIKSFLPSLYNEDPSFYEGMRVQAEAEEALLWLRWLERDDARIVWLRAERTPWKPICWEMGISRATANRR